MRLFMQEVSILWETLFFLDFYQFSESAFRSPGKNGDIFSILIKIIHSNELSVEGIQLAFNILWDIRIISLNDADRKEN